MNPSRKHTDVHAPFVKSLAEAGDWAGLARYWMAHQHEPAMEAAIDCAQKRAATDSRWQALIDYLEQVKAAPLDPRVKPADTLRAIANEAESAALVVLRLYSRAALCENAGQFPIADQERALRLGMDAALQAGNLALSCGDLALGAFFDGLLANGLQGSGQLEPARQAYSQALEFYRELEKQRPGVYNHVLSTTFNHLGSVQCDLNEFEAALFSFQEALAIQRKMAEDVSEVYRVDVAVTLNNLGTVQRALNDFEAACACYREALIIRRELARRQPEVHLPSIAMTLNNQGNAQRALKRLEEARDGIQEGLDILHVLARQQPDVYSSDLAMAINNLGGVQRDLNDLEGARDSFQAALLIRRKLAQVRPEVFLPEVAMSLNNLGTVQSELNDLMAARANCEEGLGIYRELARLRPPVYRPLVAVTLGNLGDIYRDLNSMEKARDCFLEGLEIYRELEALASNGYLAEEAVTANKLGNVLRDLGQLEAAQKSVQKALAIRRKLAEQRPQVYRPEIARTLNSLGLIEVDLNDLTTAQTHYEEGLRICRELVAERPNVYRANLAMMLNNLGLTLFELNDLEKARHTYQEGLQIYRALAEQRPEVHQPQVAGMLCNLGTAQRGLNDLEAARASYDEAVQFYATAAKTVATVHLTERQQTWLNLGQLLLIESAKLGWPDYASARKALREAVACTEMFRGLFHDEKLRKQKQERGQRGYELLVRTCVDLWDSGVVWDALPEAVVMAERSRARNLIDGLHGTDLNPANVPAMMVESFRALRQKLELARLQAEAFERKYLPEVGAVGEASPGTGIEVRLPSHLAPTAIATPMPEPNKVWAALTHWRREVEGLEREVAVRLAELQRYDPDFNPEGIAPVLSFEQIQKLLLTDVPTAFVQFMVTHEETIVLVTTRAEVFPIRLKALTDRQARDLAQAWFDQYYNKSFRGAKAALSSAREGNKSEPERSARLQEAQCLMRQWLMEWETALPGLLDRVAGQVVRPLLHALAARQLKLDRLVISPNRALHIFPLHACPLEADGTRTLGDEFEVIYTPSLSALGRCTRRSREARGEKLVVGNPTGDLRFADAEMAALMQRHPERVELWRSQATKEAFFAAAGSSWLLHYSGHALFDPAQPLDSGLILAGAQGGMSGDLLTLREVFAGLNLRRNYLTILNGCESGMLRPDLADEYVTLPSGFLYAGAVCVISTLWAVHDLSAALIMDRFHGEWQRGKSVAAALREASRWLRQDIRNGHHLMAEVIPEFLKHTEDPTLRRRCEESAQAFADKCPDSPPFASPVYWAPYICTGLGY